MRARAILAALALGLAACTSPEASRVRGRGTGGDVGNRGETVVMHEGSRPYHETPRLIPREPAPDGSTRQPAGTRR
jgi:hypothetical protein